MLLLKLSLICFILLSLSPSNYEGGGPGGRAGQRYYRRLGSPEKVYDVADIDLSSAVQGIGMIEDVKNLTDTSTKLAQGTLGIATTAAVGLYLYKKKRPTSNKTKKPIVPKPIEIV